MQASQSITNSWSLLKLMSFKWWCHSTISSSIVPFFSCLQSYPASGSFPMSLLFASVGQSIETGQQMPSNGAFTGFCSHIMPLLYFFILFFTIFKEKNFNWSIVDLQCHVSFRRLAMLFSHICICVFMLKYMYIYIQMLFLYRLLSNIE